MRTKRSSGASRGKGASGKIVPSTWTLLPVTDIVSKKKVGWDKLRDLPPSIKAILRQKGYLIKQEN